MKTNAVSERGKTKDRFLALDVNIPQEEAKNQLNKQRVLQIQMRVKLVHSLMVTTIFTLFGCTCRTLISRHEAVLRELCKWSSSIIIYFLDLSTVGRCLSLLNLQLYC